MKKEHIFTTLLLIVTISINGFSQNVSVKGRWSVNSSIRDLYAGEDISSVIQSEDDQITLSVSGNVNKSTWKIAISKSDIVWDNTLEIWLRRTGTGNGSGEVWGGTTFQKVGDVNMTFFEGKRSVNKIPVQLELRGMTVTIPAMAYSTNIVYTLYEY